MNQWWISDDHYSRARLARVAEPWPRDLLSALKKCSEKVLGYCGSQMLILRVKTLDCHWRNSRKRKYRVHSNIKSACQCADRHWHWWLTQALFIFSATQLENTRPWGALELQRVSAPEHPAVFEPLSSYPLLLTFTTKPQVWIKLLKNKWYMACDVLQSGTDFCMQDIHFRFA